jgi:hypothetical protein
MKKSILNLGKALQRKEQKQINGGTNTNCLSIDNEFECNNTRTCQWSGCYCAPNYPHLAPC